MKKLALGIVALTMLLFGLSTAPAQAGPYTGTVNTKTTASVKRTTIPVRTRPVARAKVAVRSGSVRVTTGKFRMICRANVRGELVRLKGPVARNNGRTVRVVGPKLIAKKRWTCYVKYYGGSSVFDGSQKVVRIRVR